MNQQESNLPRSLQTLGRFKLLIGCLAALGVLGGLLFAALNPVASTTSQAQVSFTAPSWSCPPGAICGTPIFQPGYAQAQLAKLFPNGVQIKVQQGNVVSVTVNGTTAAEAQASANKIAYTYVNLAEGLSYMGQQPTVNVTHAAGIATALVSPKQLFNDALLGAVAGLLVGLIAALAGGQTMIDPVALPRPPRADGGSGRDSGGSGWQSGWGQGGFSLQQLAADQVARSDDTDRSERFSPFPGEGQSPRIS